MNNDTRVISVTNSSGEKWFYPQWRGPGGWHCYIGHDNTSPYLQQLSFGSAADAAAYINNPKPFDPHEYGGEYNFSVEVVWPPAPIDPDERPPAP